MPANRPIRARTMIVIVDERDIPDVDSLKRALAEFSNRGDDRFNPPIASSQFRVDYGIGPAVTLGRPPIYSGRVIIRCHRPADASAPTEPLLSLADRPIGLVFDTDLWRWLTAAPLHLIDATGQEPKPGREFYHNPWTPDVPPPRLTIMGGPYFR